MARIPRTTMPFFFIMCAFVLLIAIFPEIVSIVPDMLANN